MSFIWLGVVILLTIAECISVGLTTIWFALFVIVGTILLITTRPILIKFIKPNEERTNLDRIIGMEGIVTEKIEKNKTGEVKVDGKRWTAYSNQTIEKNSTVKILEINGVKIKVEKVEE